MKKTKKNVGYYWILIGKGVEFLAMMNRSCSIWPFLKLNLLQAAGLTKKASISKNRINTLYFNEDNPMKNNNKECSWKVLPLAKLTVVCVLLLGTLPGIAEAGVCGRLHVRPPCVNSVDVRPNSLTGIHIVDNSLTGADILDNSLTTADILDNSLTSTDVQDNNLTGTDLADEAGADFDSADQEFPLTTTDQVVRSVAITAPKPGQVIISTSGYFYFPSGATIDVGRCAITTGTTVDFTHLIIAGESIASAMAWVPFGATRGYTVAAGTTIFNLVCNTFSGTVNLGDPNLTAIYVSTQY